MLRSPEESMAAAGIWGGGWAWGPGWGQSKAVPNIVSASERLTAFGLSPKEQGTGKVSYPHSPTSPSASQVHRLHHHVQASCTSPGPGWEQGLPPTPQPGTPSQWGGSCVIRKLRPAR